MKDGISDKSYNRDFRRYQVSSRSRSAYGVVRVSEIRPPPVKVSQSPHRDLQGSSLTG